MMPVSVLVFAVSGLVLAGVAMIVVIRKDYKMKMERHSRLAAALQRIPSVPDNVDESSRLKMAEQIVTYRGEEMFRYDTETGSIVSIPESVTKEKLAQVALVAHLTMLAERHNFATPEELAARVPRFTEIK